jgi:hypothetical protein
MVARCTLAGRRCQGPRASLRAYSTIYMRARAPRGRAGASASEGPRAAAAARGGRPASAVGLFPGNSLMNAVHPSDHLESLRFSRGLPSKLYTNILLF